MVKIVNYWQSDKYNCDFLMAVIRKRRKLSLMTDLGSSLLLFPSYLSVFRFVRFRKKQCFHIFTLVIALVPDLRKRQHTRITLMLQGALADVQQPAHIAVVQPVRMLAFLSECLVATLGKA